MEETNVHSSQQGGRVTFGVYRGEPIEWRVLERNADGSCVLLSEKGLDAVPYDDVGLQRIMSHHCVTWETSMLRYRLNNEFYMTAFSEEERKRIRKVTVENADNAEFCTNGGYDTEDYVYLMSLDEVERYFGVSVYGDVEPGNIAEIAKIGSEKLICMPTETAEKNGADILPEKEAVQDTPYMPYRLTPGACGWWLRSPGEEPSYAAFVDCKGFAERKGTRAWYWDLCIRPVICLEPAKTAANA